MAKVQDNILPLEVAVFGAVDALRAQALGAKRLELNAKGSYGDGGLSPSVAELRELGPKLNVPIRIMIRPRGPPLASHLGNSTSGHGHDPHHKERAAQDFIYTDDEFETMKVQIRAFLDAGVLNPIRGDGFVFGIVMFKEKLGRGVSEPYLAVDTARCRELIDMARPFSCVFHRAFDKLADGPDHRWEKVLASLITTGFHGVLTSGGTEVPYHANLRKFEQMCYQTINKRFQIIVGGGVRASNAKEFVERIAAVRDCDVAMHTAAIKDVGRQTESLDSDQLEDLLRVLGTAKPD